MNASLRPLTRAPYICPSCLSKRTNTTNRSFTTTRRLRSATSASSARVKLTNRSLVLLTGHDAPKFLQGLTTNNIDSSRREPWYTGFLNAQGRVLWDAIVWPYWWSDSASGGDGMGYLLEVDAGEVAGFVKHLKRHKLRSKVTMRDVGEEWDIWAAWNESATQPPRRLHADKYETWGATLDPRLEAFGDRIIRHKNDGLALLEQGHYASLEEVGLDAYNVRRYLHGIAEGQNEILRESALPMESNMDYLNGIDFRKGCYVGQELTIRTQHTGVIRKRILPVQLYDSASPMPEKLEYDSSKSFNIEQGTDIKADGARRPTGKFLASVGNVGLALCRLENMTDLRVSAEGGTYKEGVEFSVATANSEEKVKLKAFVPEWLRKAENDKMERRVRREEDRAVE